MTDLPKNIQVGVLGQHDTETSLGSFTRSRFLCEGKGSKSAPPSLQQIEAVQHRDAHDAAPMQVPTLAQRQRTTHYP
jgi:hypothetical protein